MLPTFAQDSANLHNRSVAESKYGAFKEGSANDPLEDIRKGYRSSYDDALSGELLEQRMSIKNDILSQETERLDAFIDSLSDSRDEKRREIYENALNDDGTIDYDSFASSYSDYLLENRELVSETIGSRQSFANDVMDRTSESMHAVGDRHSGNANIAANNIIDIINTDAVEYRSSVTERLDNAIAQTRTRVPIGAEALELAYIFDGECGNACDFPPPPEDETTCYYDDNNYIYMSEYEHSEYGTWEESSESIEYVLNGQTIYEYRRTSSSRGGGNHVEEGETGSREGYSRGNWIDGSYNGTGYGGTSIDYYEICVD